MRIRKNRANIGDLAKRERIVIGKLPTWMTKGIEMEVLPNEKPIFREFLSRLIRQQRYNAEKVEKIIRHLTWQYGRYIYFSKSTPNFLLKIIKPIRGRAGETISFKKVHYEGQFDLALWNKRKELLGWLGLETFHKEPDCIAIESIQGAGAPESRTELEREIKTPLANHLVKTLIGVAKESGVKRMLLIDPNYQEHIKDSANPESTRLMYLAIKTKFGFKRYNKNPKYYVKYL